MTAGRIKVLLVAPVPPPEGGIATWAKRMLRAVTDDDVTLIHADTSLRGTFAHRGRAMMRQVALTARVCSRIVADRPSVVHITTSYMRGWERDASFLALSRACGAATIVHLHGGDFAQMHAGLSPRRRERIVEQLRRCDAVVAITDETLRYLRGLGLSNAHLIPNCIDIRPARERPVRGKPVRWLFVGAVIPAKGISALFDALRRFPTAHLTLVGPNAILAKLSGHSLLGEAANDPSISGRFTHLGALSDEAARTSFDEHDIFVFPTKREGFPNAVLEAMEAGLPIVATRIGAIPEMIVDGEHGLTVDADDQAALERAIDRLMSDPQLASTLGAAARDRAITLYDVDEIAREWYRLYRRVNPARLRGRPTSLSTSR
ncbi:MAG TPA: glycosyltransferase family 4 protein [Gemmatimonadaceae bacterium]|nr:glycosyltransferase family 4 protein [Gemmatimonadaceae bacterium]